MPKTSDDLKTLVSPLNHDGNGCTTDARAPEAVSKSCGIMGTMTPPLNKDVNDCKMDIMMPDAMTKSRSLVGTEVPNHQKLGKRHGRCLGGAQTQDEGLHAGIIGKEEIRDEPTPDMALGGAATACPKRQKSEDKGFDFNVATKVDEEAVPGRLGDEIALRSTTVNSPKQQWAQTLLRK
jgi:hypothetical protein